MCVCDSVCFQCVFVSVYVCVSVIINVCEYLLLWVSNVSSSVYGCVLYCCNLGIYSFHYSFKLIHYKDKLCGRKGREANSKLHNMYVYSKGRHKRTSAKKNCFGGGASADFLVFVSGMDMFVTIC